ncbi:MAG: septum formation protein Maf, partial [Rhodospirillaceae bacterium]|nr:septum formation protein Maf [Rhodospirillaceae bacterium]
QINVTPDGVIPADIDESPLKRELPRPHAGRLATEKAKAVHVNQPDALVLGADTVVARGRRILPKAEDIETARKCLSLLSGETHRVYGGVTILGPNGASSHRVVMTSVAFKRLSQQETDRYIDSEEWLGKAGGYAIQGLAAAFVRRINGSYSNIVGLPLFETAQLLRGLGYNS